jgi:hypothetical protein
MKEISARTIDNVTRIFFYSVNLYRLTITNLGE